MGTGLGESHVMVSSPGLVLLVCRLGTAPWSLGLGGEAAERQCGDYSGYNGEGRDGEDS